MAARGVRPNTDDVQRRRRHQRHQHLRLQPSPDADRRVQRPARLVHLYPGGPNTNPIIQHLDWENANIVNVALPGHIFAGTVTHHFYESGGAVYETTTGVGNSGSWIREQANLMVGYMYFRGIYQTQLVLRAQQATMQP